MIKLEHLQKHFGTVVAVEDISLDAQPGEIFGLLGPNGAGKTTCLRMLCGLYAPSRGRVLIDGVDLQHNILAAQKQMGVLPDGGSLYERLTAQENIAFYGELQGTPRDIMKRNIEELVDILGMGDIINRRTAGFSQGERMKVKLARAIVHDPDYVILDEPTNGLDVLTTRAVRDLLLRLKARGKVVIFSSHLMHEVNYLCDKVAIVAMGKIIAHGTIEAVKQQAHCESLEDAFIHFAYPHLKQENRGATHE